MLAAFAGENRYFEAGVEKLFEDGWTKISGGLRESSVCDA